MIRSIVFSTFLLLLQSGLANTAEGLLQGDFVNMTQTNPNTYTMNDNQFNNIFPKVPLNNNSPGYVGRLRNNLGTGTATLIVNEPHYAPNTLHYVIGIGAKHTMLTKGTCCQDDIPIQQGAIFHQCALDVGNGNIASYADINVEEIWYKNDSKDIAAFVGSYPLNTINNNNDQLLLTSIPVTNNLFVANNTPIRLNHYPLGIHDMRYTQGILLQNTCCRKNRHQSSSLPGSSGAAIIVNNELVGIHTGGGNILNNVTVTYNGILLNNIQAHNLYTVSDNIYEPVSIDCIRSFNKVHRLTPNAPQNNFFRTHFPENVICNINCSLF